jgi:hypothetical protein
MKIEIPITEVQDFLSNSYNINVGLKNIDLLVEWGAIFHGSIVGELEFDSPVLIFTKEIVEWSDVKKDTTDFRKLLKDFMPLKVNRFEVFDGDLHYADNTLDAIWEVLRNAFIQALLPSIDNQININSVKTETPQDKRNLLQRIFSSGKKKDEDKKKK